MGEVIGVYSTANETVRMNDVINLTPFNSFKKLVVVTSYVLRYIHNVKTLITKEKLYTGDITLEEKSSAKSKW